MAGATGRADLAAWAGGQAFVARRGCLAVQPAADGKAPGPGWSRAARWLAVASAVLVVTAALLAGSAFGSLQQAQTCVDPPEATWFGCAWGHRLGAFVSATAG